MDYKEIRQILKEKLCTEEAYYKSDIVSVDKGIENLKEFYEHYDYNQINSAFGIIRKMFTKTWDSREDKLKKEAFIEGMKIKDEQTYNLIYNNKLNLEMILNPENFFYEQPELTFREQMLVNFAEQYVEDNKLYSQAYTGICTALRLVNDPRRIIRIYNHYSQNKVPEVEKEAFKNVLKELKREDIIKEILGETKKQEDADKKSKE